MRRHSESFSDTERGVSEVIGHLLSLSLVTVVMVGMVVGGTSYLDTRTEISTANTLDTQGEQVSRNIMTVDRLVRKSSSGGEIGQQVDLPEDVETGSYTITVVNKSMAGSSAACDRQCLVLEADDVRRTVYFATEYPVKGGTVQGGALYVNRPEGGDKIELEVRE